MDRQNKHPIDHGEQAIQRLMTECQTEEMLRLERRKPIYPKLAKTVDMGYLRGLTSLPGNTFYAHKRPPEDIPDIVA